MKCLYNVNTSCLRYIVPFKYSGTFEKAIFDVEAQRENKPDKNGEYPVLWKRRTITLDGPESDLYSYVRNEYTFENEEDFLVDQKTGCEWLYRRSAESKAKDGKQIKNLLYFPTGITKEPDFPKAWNVNVTNLGLRIFRNGLGFVWYEIEVPQKGVNSDDLISFQNVIRELNKEDTSDIWEKQTTNVRPIFGVLVKEKSGDYKDYIIPFSFGHWINSVISFLEVTYFAERKSAYKNMIKKSLHSVSGKYDEQNTIDELGGIETGILPDKAILFTYASLSGKNDEESLKEKYLLTCHITNGYKDTYHFSDEVFNEIKRPFENVFWNATQEGAAYLAWPWEDNKNVFDSTISSKVRTDYFALYLKVLYQSYSLLIYAEKIQTEISAVNGKGFAEPADKRITELFEEINLFLAKSMATSVSHIHHQSEFYVYLKKRLRIHDDVKSVTAGLNALGSLQREQWQREESRRSQEAWQEEQRRDREAKAERAKQEEREKESDGKIQAIMGLFALLGISSALVDCFDFIGKFDPKNGDFWELVRATRWWEIAFFVIIGIISVLASIFSVKAIIDAFKNRDKEKKRGK